MIQSLGGSGRRGAHGSHLQGGKSFFRKAELKQASSLIVLFSLDFAGEHVCSLLLVSALQLTRLSRLGYRPGSHRGGTCFPPPHGLFSVSGPLGPSPGTSGSICQGRSGHGSFKISLSESWLVGAGVGFDPDIGVSQVDSSRLKIYIPRNSLAVQWLGLSLSLQGAWVQSAVGELRSCMPPDRGKNKVYIP